MGCHLVSFSKADWSSTQGLTAIKYYFTVWFSPVDFHLHWSTTTRKASCQRYKATSLSATTHSSFVFLRCSPCIMFCMLFSGALWMWNFKCRVFKNNNNNKKKSILKITELCTQAASGCLKSSVYQEFKWFMYCWFELLEWQKGGVRGEGS